jgi:hypothetical protein
MNDFFDRGIKILLTPGKTDSKRRHPQGFRIARRGLVFAGAVEMKRAIF